MKDEDLQVAFAEFDKANEKLKYDRCEICHQVRLGMKTEMVTHGVKTLRCCSRCFRLDVNEVEFLQKTLPTWFDPKTKKLQYHIPQQLAILREGEKLIIQRANVYMPVYHLKMGQTACKGHCVSFRQHIGDIVEILPRLPEEVEYLQVIKKYKDKKGIMGRNIS